MPRSIVPVDQLLASDEIAFEIHMAKTAAELLDSL